jgi:hypothetical protein
MEIDPQLKATEADDTEELIDYSKRWRDRQS